MPRDDQRAILQRLVDIGTALPTVDTMSSADRLRPPYMSPLRGATPANVGASRLFEVGFNRLPAEYQRLLREAPVNPLSVGHLGSGWNVGGLLMPRRTPPVMLGESPQSMTHELIHELARRLNNPWNKGVEEALSRHVAGDPSFVGRSYDVTDVDKARTLDATLTMQGALSPLQRALAQLLGMTPEKPEGWMFQ